MNPKVFVSHASDDKERFVLNFATKLYEVGIEAWIDQWEMLPGDSLVDKIFEEGIKEAQAFIIIISKYSIDKPWVKEELNTAIVNRIGNNTKIIPIVLDKVEIPECLKSTLYEPINNLLNYDKSFERIKNAILGFYEKPSLGKLPTYSTIDFNIYNGLNKLDSIVLNYACRLAIKENSVYKLESDTLYESLESFEISEYDFKTSIDILDRNGYIKGLRVIGGNIPIFELNYSTLELYINEYYADFYNIEKRVCISIINNEGNNSEIAKELNIPVVLINYVFNKLKNRRLISYTALLNGNYLINDISPGLSRIVQDM